MIPWAKVFMAPEARKVAGDVLESGYIGDGERVKEFETWLQTLTRAPEKPLALNSCTSALDLAVHLCDLHRGDEVITTPMTCTATNGVLVNRGLKIVWADVDPLTGLMEPDDVKKKVTKRTKLIMAVDWAGRSCDYNSLKETRLPVIQDAAHMLLFDPTNCGDYVCWSFQAIKHLTTVDGGAIMVPYDERKRARLLRWYGLDRETGTDFRCAQSIYEAGFKYHMNDVAAVIGMANMSYVQNNIEKGRQNALYYNEHLPHEPGFWKPEVVPTHNWWLYCLLVDNPTRFMDFLKEYGVGSSQVHRRNDEHPAYWFPNGSLPGVDYFSSHEVAIPVGWWVTREERDHIVDVIRKYLQERKGWHGKEKEAEAGSPVLTSA